MVNTVPVQIYSSKQYSHNKSNCMSGSLNFIIQNYVNMLLNKKMFAYFVRPEKGKQRTFSNIALFSLFALFVIFLNQAIFIIISPPNLFREAGVSRLMSSGQIKNNIQSRRLNIMTDDRLRIQQRVAQYNKLEQIEKLLSHNARRLSYDTFGYTAPQYAWAFLQPSFITSMIIQSSVFYIICLFMNLMNTDRNQLQNAFGLKVTAVIIIFITEIQIIIHTQDRLLHSPDLFDYVYSFTVHERREVMKLLVVPIMILIEDIYLLFIETEAEYKLKKFVGIVEPNQLFDIKSKIKDIETNNNPHLDQNVQVALRELETKVESDIKKLTKKQQKQNLSSQEPIPELQGLLKQKQNIELFRLQRNLITKLLQLQAQNVFRDQRFLQLRDQYKLPFN